MTREEKKLPDGLEEEIDKYFRLWRQGASDEGCVNAGSQFVSIYDCHRIARHFYELGRNQVLQEIYEGKVKPVDKITAAWLDDDSKDKEDK